MRPEDPRLGRAALAFVALGVALRVARYALNSPLWWNEAFVAVNFLRRGYLDLLEPLDYGQVCPIGFLWLEKAIVDAFGFSEPTLRLAPLLCGVAALVLFDRLAARAMPGPPRLLATAILAVSYHPIRLAAEAKPYASDLLVAVALILLAWRWLEDRGRVGRLWALAGFAPAALAMSHPSAFVAGGLWLALLPAVARQGRRSAWLGWLAFGLATSSAFGGLYLLYTKAQGAATLDGMRAYWADAFPPLDAPGSLPGWLLGVHAGRMLAYPVGGDGGGSAGTLVLALMGVAALAGGRGRSLLLALLAPFALTLLASAIGRHPYGGHPRIAQHLAPSACLLAGLGLAGAIGRRRRAVGLACVALAALGAAPLAGDVARPYRSKVEADARDFARAFWPEQSRRGGVACLRRDLGVAGWESPDLDVALYLANQAIHAPRRAGAPGRGAAPADRPLRCVLYHSPRDEPGSLPGWLAGMESRFDLVARTEHPVGDRGVVTVFEFAPRGAGARRAALSRRGPAR
jgi:hypothetical protein